MADRNSEIPKNRGYSSDDPARWSLRSPPLSTMPFVRWSSHASRRLNLQNHGHDERSFLGLLGDVTFQVGTDLFFDYAVVGLLFFAGMGERIFDHAFGAFHQAFVANVE